MHPEAEETEMSKALKRRRKVLQTVTVGLLSGVVVGKSVGAKGASRSSLSDKERVRSALSDWMAGTNSVVGILSENVKWTIVGNSLVAGTTNGKAELFQKVLVPFAARFSQSSKKFRPTRIAGVYQDQDTVIAHFHGEGIANDGKPYINTYAWFLKMENGYVVDATAFFDSLAFNDLWERVIPA